MIISRRLKIIVVVAAFGLWIPVRASAQPLAGSAQDPLAGSRVFGAKGCSTCHAINGIGGKVGPDLGRLTKPRTFYDLASAMWNHLPQMEAEMRKLRMAPPHLSPQETGDLVAFLATVNYFDPSGNPKRGKEIFRRKQCIVCHQVERVGGVIGPSLDSVLHFGPIFIAAAMWNHGPTMTEAMRERGIKRPVFKGSELSNLFAYLRSVSVARGNQPLHVLAGDPGEGKRLFASKGCVDCHGIRGLGGPVGPALAGRRFIRSLIDFAAAMWNKAPAMMKEMNKRFVAVPKLLPSEMADIIGYLYSVDYFAGRGNARRGREIVEAKGCLRCHAVGGKGGTIAPDFQRIPGLGEPVTIVAAMWNHAGAMEKKMREKVVAWPIFKGDEMAHVMAFLQELGKPRE